MTSRRANAFPNAASPKRLYDRAQEEFTQSGKDKDVDNDGNGEVDDANDDKADDDDDDDNGDDDYEERRTKVRR